MRNKDPLRIVRLKKNRKKLKGRKRRRLLFGNGALRKNKKVVVRDHNQHMHPLRGSRRMLLLQRPSSF